MRNIVGLNNYDMLSEGITPAIPETLNIYLSPLSSIPSHIVDANNLADDIHNRQADCFWIQEYTEPGDWVMCIGQNEDYDINVCFGYKWGDIRIFDGVEYFAQHADSQFHHNEGWRIRVKFDEIDWILAKPGYYKSEDGKKILWREVEDAES